jgi:hypothetical protein
MVSKLKKNSFKKILLLHRREKKVGFKYFYEILLKNVLRPEP